MDSYEGRTEIADDLRRLGDVIRLNDEIPVHEFGPVDIMYCVIEGDHDEREARFNAHADDMQRIAAEMGLGFTYASSIDDHGDEHHRATLTMPNKQVTYRVTWIDRKVQTDV
jgi:hypothetical protein